MPPELPATTLVESCYSYMFMGCVSLTKAPDLPATALVGGCYTYMFASCPNITYIKAMFINMNTSALNTWVG